MYNLNRELNIQKKNDMDKDNGAYIITTLQYDYTKSSLEKYTIHILNNNKNCLHIRIKRHNLRKENVFCSVFVTNGS